MEYPNVDDHDLKITIPSGVIVSGPSSSGKTELVLKILKHAADLFQPLPKAIIWAYGEFSELIPKLERDGVMVHSGLPSDEMLSKIPKPFVLVLDDLMGEIDPKKLADLFTKKSHHNNFTVIFLSQNLFDKALRVPRSNAQFIFLMRAPVCFLFLMN
jgi:hypothetical protein